MNSEYIQTTEMNLKCLILRKRKPDSNSTIQFILWAKLYRDRDYRYRNRSVVARSRRKE